MPGEEEKLPHTCDEYVIKELAKMKAQVKKLSKENGELQDKLDSVIVPPPLPTTVETKFTCWSNDIAADYQLRESFTLDELKDIISSPSKFQDFVTNGKYKRYGDTHSVLKVVRHDYNFEINYFGRIVGICIYNNYNDTELNCCDYIVDEKRYFSAHDPCQEVAEKKLREEVESAIKQLEQKAAEEAKKAAEEAEKGETNEQVENQTTTQEGK